MHYQHHCGPAAKRPVVANLSKCSELPSAVFTCEPGSKTGLTCNPFRRNHGRNAGQRDPVVPWAVLLRGFDISVAEDGIREGDVYVVGFDRVLLAE